MRVAIFFGSKSDTEIMKGAANCLKEFGISYKAMFDNASHLGLQVLATVGTCVMLVLLMLLFGVSKDERIIIFNIIKKRNERN